MQLILKKKPPWALPAKRGKRYSKRFIQETTDVSSVSGDHQTDLLTGDDIPTIVQAVWDELPWRNSSNAATPTSGMPVSQGVDSPHMQQSTNANQHQEDGELLPILNIARWTNTGIANIILLPLPATIKVSISASLHRCRLICE